MCLENRKIKLFTLSHAGSSSTIYRRWCKYLSKEIEICPVELPGRGIKGDQKLLTTFELALDAGYREIEKNIDPRDINILYGQSMGALLGYELCHRMLNGGYDIKHFFAGACQAPQLLGNELKLSRLDDGTFFKHIISFGGMDADIAEDREIFNIYFPIMRADFQVFDDYIYENKSKLNINMTILYGTEDKFVDANNLTEWIKLTNGKCNITPIFGNHFFHIHNPQVVCELINSLL